MYNVEEKNGVVMMKNGGSRWQRPVVYGDDVFKSMKDLSIHIGVNTGTVSATARDGGKINNTPVRTATRAEVEAAINNQSFKLVENKPVKKTASKKKTVAKKKAVQKQPPRVFRVDGNGDVEVRSSYGWARAYAHNGSVATVSDIAREKKITVAAAAANVRDRQYQRARLADAVAAGYVQVHTSVEFKSAPKKKVKAPDGKKPDTPFVGVRWPGGGVDIRFADGRRLMSRDALADVPQEIVEACRWLA